jgi:geranylgeranyl diphosphate synthase type I
VTSRPLSIATGSARQLAIDVDKLISPHIAAALESLDAPAPLLSGMSRYHLGLVDRDFIASPDGHLDRGKRIRPMVALLCCAAAGGHYEDAAPLAAAIELLHNFTLVHDDIQDHSPTRRHRATVWALWGNAQAINAGDALFATAHTALYRLRNSGASAELILELADAFDRMTIDIVAGQVLDLDFERRQRVSPSDYLEMIAGKTAAIVRYAAWAGALLGGADAESAERFGEFGLALGLGFQVQDDLLGVWGASAETGKAKADDIRRKKQSFPILLLRAAAGDEESAELDAIYEQPEIDPNGVERMLDLLDQFDIRSKVRDRVRTSHDDARIALESACPGSSPAKAALGTLIEQLAGRSS